MCCLQPTNRCFHEEGRLSTMTQSSKIWLMSILLGTKFTRMAIFSLFTIFFLTPARSTIQFFHELAGVRLIQDIRRLHAGGSYVTFRPGWSCHLQWPIMRQLLSPLRYARSLSNRRRSRPHECHRPYDPYKESKRCLETKKKSPNKNSWGNFFSKTSSSHTKIPVLMLGLVDFLGAQLRPKKHHLQPRNVVWMAFHGNGFTQGYGLCIHGGELAVRR